MRARLLTMFFISFLLCNSELRAEEVKSNALLWHDSSYSMGYSDVFMIKDLVVYNLDNSGLRALNKFDGKPIWSDETCNWPSEISNPKVLKSKTLYIAEYCPETKCGSGSFQIRALDVLCGKTLWKKETCGSFIDTELFVLDSNIYFGDREGRIHKLNLDTREDKILPLIEKGIFSTDPVYHNGNIYFGIHFEDDDVPEANYFFSIEPETLTVLWQIEHKGYLRNDLVFMNNKIILNTLGSEWKDFLYIINSKTGDIKLCEPFPYQSTVLLCNKNEMTVSKKNSLLSISLKNGDILKSKEFDFYCHFFKSGGILYVHNADNHMVYEVDLKTFDLKSRFELIDFPVEETPIEYNEIAGSCVTDNGKIYIRTTKGMQCYRLD